VKARFASYDTQLRPLLSNTKTLDLAALIVLPPLISHRFQPSNPAVPLIPAVLAMFDWIAQHGVTDCTWDPLVVLSAWTRSGLVGGDGSGAYVGIGADRDDTDERANAALMTVLLHELGHNQRWGAVGSPPP
jgi:hypothetical protein